tara:strand:+ start:2377 stop:4185 length:1809 start_codon:yes stop_codon:yes gene_type:complete
MSIVGSIVQSSGGGGGGTSFTDVSTAVDYTVTGTTSERIYVDTTSAAVSITLPSGASNQVIEVIDAGEHAGTNIITIVGTIDGVSNSTIEADDGAKTIAYSGTAWETSGGFQNYFKRNAATGEISTQAPDTLLANAVTSGNAGALSEKSVADTDFTNIGVNVDVSVADEFSNDTGETTLNTFDTRLATSTSGAFSAGTFKAYDNVAALITGTGKVNVAYSVDGGAFVGGLVEELATFNAGNGNTTVSNPYVISTTSEYDTDTFSAWRAFDLGTNSWTSTGISGNSVTLDLGLNAGRIFTSYRLNLAGVGTRTLTAWTIAGSNDNSSFTNLDVVTGHVGTTWTNILSLGNTTNYRYYRLTADANNGDATYCDITEIDFRESIESPVDQDTFKALGDIAYTTQFDIRLQLVGAQRFSKVTISTPNTVLQLTSDGQAQVMDGGSKVSSFGKLGVAPVSLTTTERDALTGMDDGAIIFNETTGVLNTYNGTVWKENANSDGEGVISTAITSTSNSIATNAALSKSFTHLTTENTTLANPTNLKAGKTYTFTITQSASTARTLAYGSAFKFSGGTAPILTASVNAVDLICGISDGTNIYCNFLADVQ